MKKSSSSSPLNKKKKPGKTGAARSSGTAAAAPANRVRTASPQSGDPLQSMLDQLKNAVLEKIETKINTVNIRLDRIENSLQEVLDEIRESESFLEEETEPYEGQA